LDCTIPIPVTNFCTSPFMSSLVLFVGLSLVT
jgi:hypothetical protein